MLVQAFDTVINWAFTAMLVIYGAVAGLGYYYFGDAASTLITEDLAANSPFTGRSVSTSFNSQFFCCSDFCHCIQADVLCCLQGATWCPHCNFAATSSVFLRHVSVLNHMLGGEP